MLNATLLNNNQSFASEAAHAFYNDCSAFFDLAPQIIDEWRKIKNETKKCVLGIE